ncbi:MAG: hypothetical protein R2764_01995 [Bacteroidales bacterium]
MLLPFLVVSRTLLRGKSRYQVIQAMIYVVLFRWMPIRTHTGNAGVNITRPDRTGKRILFPGLGKWGEVNNGEIIFNPALLNREEILDEEAVFAYYSIQGESHEIKLNKNQLAFTFCQVPIIYTISNKNEIAITFVDGRKKMFSGNVINAKISAEVFTRSGTVDKIAVSCNKRNVK